MQLSKVEKLIRKEIQDLQPYQSAREEFVNDGRKLILLDANENPYPTSVNRYPDPMQTELKKQLAVFKEILPENIHLSNGSDELISQLVLAFCEPGKDHILIVPPTFGMYAVAAKIFGVAVEEVPLTAEFQLNVPSILAQANKHSKILFIPTPNNPSGNHFSKKDLEQLAKSFNGILVIDEAYFEFSQQPSYLSWLEKYPNLVVCQTFSKAQGMAGIRFGMTFAHPMIIAVMNKIKAPYNLNVLTQRAVMNRLGNQTVVADQVKKILQQKERLITALKTISFIKKIFPSDANFILVRVDNSSQRYAELVEHGFIVRNPSKQVLCENTLRITIGTVEETSLLIRALEQMDKK